MRGVINEMLTLQVENIPVLAENVSKVVKNSPEVNNKLDSINDNIKKL